MRHDPNVPIARSRNRVIKRRRHHCDELFPRTGIIASVMPQRFGGALSGADIDSGASDRRTEIRDSGMKRSGRSTQNANELVHVYIAAVNTGDVKCRGQRLARPRVEPLHSDQNSERRGLLRGTLLLSLASAPRLFVYAASTQNRNCENRSCDNGSCLYPPKQACP